MNFAAWMSPPRATWRNLLTSLADQTGAVALEYGLIAALIAVTILGTLVQLGETLFGLPLQSLIDALAGSLS